MKGSYFTEGNEQQAYHKSDSKQALERQIAKMHELGEILKRWNPVLLTASDLLEALKSRFSTTLVTAPANAYIVTDGLRLGICLEQICELIQLRVSQPCQPVMSMDDYTLLMRWKTQEPNVLENSMTASFVFDFLKEKGATVSIAPEEISVAFKLQQK
jgi:hypothetical protein